MPNLKLSNRVTFLKQQTKTSVFIHEVYKLAGQKIQIIAKAKHKVKGTFRKRNGASSNHTIRSVFENSITERLGRRRLNSPICDMD